MSASGQSLDQFLRQQFDVLQIIRDNMPAILKVAERLTPVEDLQDFQDQVGDLHAQLGALVEASDLILSASPAGVVLLQAIDAPAQRAALELGSAALRSEDYFATASALQAANTQLTNLSAYVDNLALTLASKASQGDLDALAARVGTIEGSFENTVRAILSAAWGDSYYGQVTALTTPLQTQITNQGGQITALGERTSSLETSLATIDGAQAATASALDAVTTRVTATENGITALSSDVTALAAELTNAQEQLTLQADAVSSLSTQLTDTDALAEATAAQTQILTSRITDAEAGLAGETTARQELATRVTSTESDLELLSTSVDEVQANLSGGGNLVWNAGFEVDLSHWELFTSEGWSAAAMTRDVIDIGLDPAMPTLTITNTGVTPTGSAGVRGHKILVNETQRYILSGYLAAVNCTARLEYRVYNDSNEEIGFGLIGSKSTGGIPTALSAWPRFFINMLLPTGAAFIELQLWATNCTGAPRAFLFRPQVEEARTSQMNPSPWVEGSGGMATAGAVATEVLTARVTEAEGAIAAMASDVTNIHSQIEDPVTGLLAQASARETLETQVATHNGQITTLYAQYTMTLDVNGRITGWKFVNDGTTGVADFVADVFRITAPAGFKSVEFRDGILSSKGTSHARYMGVDFGEDAAFIDWYGPTPGSGAPGALTNNGIFWIKKDGSAYFGGALAGPSVLEYSAGVGVNLMPDAYSTFEAGIPATMAYTSCSSDGVVPGRISQAMRLLSGGAGSGDPDFNNVVTLLHGNGTNGSTAINDSSNTPKVWTALNGAAISTAETSAIGGSSILFDGANDYLSSPAHADWAFGNGDFCVDIAVVFNSHVGTATLISNYSGSTAGFVLQWRSETGTLRVGYGDSVLLDSSSFVPTNGVKYRLRASRVNGTLRLFRDGTIIGSVANNTNMSSTAAMYVGRLGTLAAQHFSGYAEEIRITKGSGRETANYVPGAGAFPDASSTVGSVVCYAKPPATTQEAKVSIDAGRKYIISAFVTCSAAINASDITMVMEAAGGDTVSAVCTAQAIAANVVTRVTAVVDTTALGATTWSAIAYAKFAVSSGLTIDIDGYMVEEQIGYKKTPSSYARGLSASATIAATVAAENAAGVAQAAALDAASALNQLDDIASDSVLTADEKVRIRVKYRELMSEQAGIDSEATLAGITTEKTAYDTAITALKTYLKNTLGLLDAVYNWTNITGSTNVDRTVWEQKWLDVFATRQTVLNLLAVVGATGANMLQNTEFMLGMTGWTSTTGGVAKVADGYRYQVTLADAVSTTLYQDVSYSIFPPQKFSASVEMGWGGVGITANAKVKLQIIFLSSVGAQLGIAESDYFIPGANAAGSTRILQVHGATAPTNTTTVRYQLTMVGNIVWYARKPKLERNKNATAYIPGADGFYGTELTYAGSQRQIGDLRNVPPGGFANVGSAWISGALSYSAAAGSPASATISMTAGTLRLPQSDIAYSASSVGVTGTGGTTVVYLLYYEDLLFQGGSRTLGATTTMDTIVNSLGRVYVGKISVTFPTAGTGSGGGATPCMVEDAVIQFGEESRVIGEAAAGELFHCVDPTTKQEFLAPATYSRKEHQVPCVLLITRNGVEMPCSIYAKICTKEGLQLAPFTLGNHMLTKVRGVIGYSEIVKVRQIGLKTVQHVTVEEAGKHESTGSFWSGAKPDFYGAHHNIKYT